MCRSVEKELRVLLGVAKSIVGLLWFLVWVLFSGFSIFCIQIMSLGDCTCWQHQETTVEPH